MTDPETWPDKTYQCMVHRYLYYCLASPVISDYEYDRLEAEAKREDPDGPLSQPGVDLESWYPEAVKQIARALVPTAPFEE